MFSLNSILFLAYESYGSRLITWLLCMQVWEKVVCFCVFQMVPSLPVSSLLLGWYSCALCKLCLKCVLLFYAVLILYLCEGKDM